MAILIATKRYMAVIAGLIGGIIYFAVDYGIFYLLLGTREVSRGKHSLASSVVKHKLWVYKFFMDMVMA